MIRTEDCAGLGGSTQRLHQKEISMKRPNQFDLLKSFLDYLREQQDLTLLGNSVFKDSSRWVKVPPRKGDEVSINIFFT